MLPWLVLLGLILLLYVNSVWIRKVLGVERRSFVDDYMNDQHRKITKYIQMSCLVIVVILAFSGSWFSSYPQLFGIAVLLFITLTESVRIYMLYRYGNNKKEWLATLQELIILLVFILGVMYYAMNDPL